MVSTGTHLRAARRPDRIRSPLDRHVPARPTGDREGPGGERVRDPTHTDRVSYRPGRWSDPRGTVERPAWAETPAVDRRRRVRPGLASVRDCAGGAVARWVSAAAGAGRGRGHRHRAGDRARPLRRLGRGAVFLPADPDHGSGPDSGADHRRPIAPIHVVARHLRDASHHRRPPLAGRRSGLA